MLFQYGYDFTLSIPGLVVSTVISIIVAIAISNDARARGMDPTGYVLLTCCCSWCVGGIVYLIVRSNNAPAPPMGNSSFSQPPSSGNYGEPSPNQNSYYGQPSSGQSTYRPTSSPGNEKICTMCGSPNPIDARFCSNCGSNSFSNT